MNVSVVIPVYNAQPFVEKSIRSALALDEVREVIVVDDGSTDGSMEICQAISNLNDKVILLMHAGHVNMGPSASRNLGIQNASCEYVAFLDSDDFFLPNRFIQDKNVFDQDSKVDGVYNAIGVNFYNKKSRRDFEKHMKNVNLTTVHTVVSPDKLFYHLAQLDKYVGYFSLDGLTIKTKSLQKISHWFNPQLRIHEDTDFLIRLSFYLQLKGGSLNQPVTLRGVHDFNRILEVRKSKKAIFRNQVRLWGALVQWSDKTCISQSYVDHFKKMHSLYNILDLKKLNTVSSYRKLVATDISYLYHSCYYRPVHDLVFGENVLSKILFRSKVLVQRLLKIPIGYYE